MRNITKFGLKRIDIMYNYECCCSSPKKPKAILYNLMV